MNKEPKPFWVTVNRLMAPIAFVVIGAIIWFSLRPKAPEVASSDAPAPSTSIDQSSTDQNSGPSPKLNSESDSEPAAKEGLPVDTNSNAEPPEQPSQDGKEAPAETKPAEAETPALPEPTPIPNLQPSDEIGAAPKFYETNVAKFLFEKKCTACHKQKRIEGHQFVNYGDVDTLVDKMEKKMVKKGIDVNEKEIAFLKFYVKETYVGRNVLNSQETPNMIGD